jgi:RNA polymerase sigma factor (sigma-70 family)
VRTPVDPRWHEVAGALKLLSPLERRVVVYAYARGMTLKEIGARVALSESGVCRVRARALKRLRQACAAEVTVQRPAA